MGFLTSLIALICSLSVIGLVFPHGFPLLSPLILVAFVIYMIRVLMKGKMAQTNSELILLYYFCLLFVLWGGLLSQKLYQHFLQDAVNGIMVMILIPVLTQIYKYSYFDSFKKKFTIINVVLLTPISLYCLYKFYRLLQGVKLDFISSESDIYPWGTSLQSDYNMCALGLMVGVFSCLFLFYQTKSLIAKIIIFSAALIMFFTALLTGSRRMFVVFGISAVGLLIYLIYKIFKGIKDLLIHHSIRNLSRNNLMAVIVLLILVFIVTYNTSIFKNLDISNFQEIEKLAGRLETLSGGAETLQESRGYHAARAVELIGNFTPFQFFFGNGFNYLGKMSFTEEEDYPHNPVLSAVLYGGIFSGITIVLFIFRSFFLYIKNFRNELFFSFLFLLTFSFAVISSNSIFSLRLFLVQIVIGYLINSKYSSKFQ